MLEGYARARVMSSILGSRLLQIIGKHGTDLQFGSQPERGCRWLYYQTEDTTTKLPESFFVDLAKAFDTYHHALMRRLDMEHRHAP